MQAALSHGRFAVISLLFDQKSRSSAVSCSFPSCFFVKASGRGAPIIGVDLQVIPQSLVENHNVYLKIKQYLNHYIPGGIPVSRFLIRISVLLQSVEKVKEMKQKASYARWTLAAGVINATVHYLIITGTTDKDKNTCNIFAPYPFPVDSRAQVIYSGSPPHITPTSPPPSRRRHREAVLNGSYRRKWDSVKLCVYLYGNINADQTENFAEVSSWQMQTLILVM
jgi:hypothetical protein